MTKCLNPFLAPPDLTILSGEYCESGEAVFNIHKKTTLDKTMAFQQGEAPHNGLQVSSDNASCYQQSQEKEHPLEITRLPAHHIWLTNLLSPGLPEHLKDNPMPSHCHCCRSGIAMKSDWMFQ